MRVDPSVNRNSNRIHFANRTGSAFWPLQLVLIVATIVGACFIATEVNRLPAVPKLTNKPRVIMPEYNLPMVVSDEQLQTVLTKIHPKFPTTPPKTNFVDHALRMWGTSIEFDDFSLNGAQLRELLLKYEVFENAWGANEPPLLKQSEFGISVRTQEGRSTVSHVDHLIGTLSEIGTTLDHPIFLKTRNGTVKDLHNHMFKSFALNQKEYEWTALAWAFYADGPSTWYTSDKQAITFDNMARRMMRQEQPQGVCYGQHRLYSMTIMLRADDQAKEAGQPLLEPETREMIIDYLGSMTAKLYRTQSLEGHWDANWPDTSKAISDPQTDPLSRRILATGHTLEWWAMAPAELHPPRETIVRAGQWLANVIGEMEPAKIEKNYTFLTHAARALALWRGKLPDQADVELRKYRSYQGPIAESQPAIPIKQAKSSKIQK